LSQQQICTRNSRLGLDSALGQTVPLCRGEHAVNKRLIIPTCILRIVVDSPPWPYMLSAGFAIKAQFEKPMAAAFRYSFLFHPPDDPFRSEAETVCSVVVVYEDAATRDRAMGVCEHLVHAFRGQIEFDVGWWKFRYLLDPELAQAATRDAADADMIIVSAHADAELTTAVKDWMETWAAHRADREGALVALVEAGSSRARNAPPLEFYLRALARRARMDFLAPVDQGRSQMGPFSLAPVHLHASPGTPILRGLPHDPKPPPHWGLNE